MLRRRQLVVGAMLILGLVLGSCQNFPMALQGPQELSSEDLANTAVAKVMATQQAAQAAPVGIPAVEDVQAAPATATPVPAQCVGTVTAITNANVRGGPSVDYAIVGNLPIGATAPIAGKNDANTWWYIQFAGGFGGYAWVAGSVVSAACVPASLPVIAAPALPTAVPTEVVQNNPTQPWSIPPLLLHKFPSPTPTLVKLQLPHDLQPVPVVPIGP